MTDAKSNERVAAGCIAGVAIIVLTIPVRAYVIADLWAWFIAPLGPATIGMWHALGISVFVAAVNRRQPESLDDDRDNRPTLRRMLTTAARPLVYVAGVWAVGWAVHTWGMG